VFRLDSVANKQIRNTQTSAKDSKLGPGIIIRNCVPFTTHGVVKFLCFGWMGLLVALRLHSLYIYIYI
jgi:hypothetical protein